MERPKFLAASAVLTVAAIISRGEVRANNNDCLLWPIEGTVSQEFSSSDIGGHSALDIDPYPAKSVPVVASANGKVAYTSESEYSLGKEIDVETSDNNHLIIYGHLSKIFVNGHDVVRKGEVIGLSGSTGYSTGEHLHFEVYDYMLDHLRKYNMGQFDGWVAVDPRKYLCKKTD